MNVLVTNPQEIQAYVILRALRRRAGRIVVTEGGDSINRTGFRGMSAFSRYVDARHRVPHFAADWLAGRLEPGNTAAEEAYIQRIEEICRLERIDVIFPSLDPEVYVFAKNKQRLARQGIVAVVPEPEVIRVPMDKGLTMSVAERVGFPCPRTFFPRSADDLAQVVAGSTPPWIVKPRFTAHGENMAFASNAEELQLAYANVAALQRDPIVQEYVAGMQRQNYYVILDRQGQMLTLFAPRSTRTHDWGKYRVSTKTAVSATSAPYLPELRALLHELGLWGGYTVQTKIDPRDGIPKLMEINARLGQHLWWRTGLGVDEPWIFLQLARGETPSGNFAFREGVMLLDPYHDLFDLYARAIDSVFNLFARLFDRRARSEPAAEATPGTWHTLRVYARDYINLRRKVLCPEFSSLLTDPYPCLQAFWFKFRPMTASWTGRISDAVRRRARRAANALGIRSTEA